MEKLDVGSLGYALTLTDPCGSLCQSNFLNLITAVSRQNIWVAAAFRLTKDRLLKDFFFPLSTGLLTLQLKINQCGDCEEPGSEKFCQKGFYSKLRNTQNLGNVRKKACWVYGRAVGTYTSLVSTILVYIKLYFKSDDYTGWVSASVPKLPNKYQILSRASCHPHPQHLNHANYTELTLEYLWLGENNVFPILGAFFILFI